MRRYLGLVAAILLAAVLSGCGPKSAPPAKAPEGGGTTGGGATVKGSTVPTAPTAPAVPNGPVAISGSPGSSYGAMGTAPAPVVGGGKDGPVLPPVIKEGSGGWCSAGESYDDGSQQYKVTGIVQFKGKQFCQAVIDNDGGKIAIYFTEDDSDAWMVMTVGGQTQEIHLSDGN